MDIGHITRVIEVVPAAVPREAPAHHPAAPAAPAHPAAPATPLEPAPVPAAPVER